MLKLNCSLKKLLANSETYSLSDCILKARTIADCRGVSLSRDLSQGRNRMTGAITVIKYSHLISCSLFYLNRRRNEVCPTIGCQLPAANAQIASTKLESKA